LEDLLIMVIWHYSMLYNHPLLFLGLIFWYLKIVLEKNLHLGLLEGIAFQPETEELYKVVVAAVVEDLGIWVLEVLDMVAAAVECMSKCQKCKNIAAVLQTMLISKSTVT
jgi:hypothetical protein